ncbi:nanoRNase/pAp phosphatase, hydrolyzes c-di-AMP and oligoRNAs [Halopenitus malekzadehii]|uniref:NanoRNase/pAp phosphatase, hydrolyzes c-di-AMP and oligoRNAs n=1 Tax=Halopenitus malekzadehii TaxID=1267564 RepID=A0A1H6HP41_9EURY|nr:DHHA1 domain-containing protein [Halopenitus malekzadehii]SEH37617.1 nanoRNase/pAp phosphatase, hydrolyzes c-di-AMP and oligoRNAs [Halopenitus malekzadehii]
MGQVTAGEEWFAAVEPFIRENPELTVATAIAVVVVLGSLYAFVRLRRAHGVRFRRLIADADELTVLMHPNPDPDAMAAAVGVVELAAQVDVDATIQYPGQIRHQENRAFRTVLDLELDQIDHVTDLASESVVLVDHNEARGFGGTDGILPLAVIDHHPGDGAGEEFTDVRTDYGATASIVAEYFEDNDATPVPPDRHASETDGSYTLPTSAATGLLYGILADTNHLTVGASEADFAAASYLYPGVDQDRLDRIANPAVDAEVLEVKARAIAGRQVEGSFAVADVGSVNNVDAIPQAADELIQLEGVTAVVIVGERDGTIHLSGRSRDDRVHMGKAIEEALADVPNGDGGGHARMGGGRITPDVDPTDDSIEEAVDRDALSAALFRAMAGDV